MDNICYKNSTWCGDEGRTLKVKTLYFILIDVPVFNFCACLSLFHFLHEHFMFQFALIRLWRMFTSPFTEKDCSVSGGCASENFVYWATFCFSLRELKWMLMTSSGCIHYSWTRLAPASFLKNTKQNSCSTKTNHPSLRLKPWRLRPELIDAFPIPVYIACSILFLNLSMSCAALVNIWKTLPQTNWKPF